MYLSPLCTYYLTCSFALFGARLSPLSLNASQLLSRWKAALASRFCSFRWPNACLPIDLSNKQRSRPPPAPTPIFWPGHCHGDDVILWFILFIWFSPSACTHHTLFPCPPAMPFHCQAFVAAPADDYLVAFFPNQQSAFYTAMLLIFIESH